MRMDSHFQSNVKWIIGSTNGFHKMKEPICSYTLHTKSYLIT